MIKQGKVVSITMISALFALVLLAGVLFAADATITGKVDDQYQILSSDGDIYVIADTGAGTEVATKHINETVEVVGSVGYSEEDDMKIITIKQYKVVSPDSTNKQ